MKHTTKAKLKKFQKKILKPIANFFIRGKKVFIYLALFLLGLLMMSLAFWLPIEWNNAINVCCGIGTGIFTSVLVTVIINAENAAREKRKLQKEKEFLFNDIILSSLDVYQDVIYRINEYITLSQLNMKGIYALYSDFKPFNAFADHLKTIEITKLSADEKKRIDRLFNFRNYRIDWLISNIKHLPRQEYYLKGLLTEEEYHSLVSDSANDSYMSYAEHIHEFWDDEVLDLPKCIQFLRMTIYITSRTISTFDYASKKAKTIDADMQKQMDELYYFEVYTKSEEYVMAQVEAEMDRWNYYAEHPEELEALEAQYNRTEEDFALDELGGCICGFSEHDAAELLDKLDKNSEKVKAFFNQNYVRKMLKKKRKIRSIIKAKYGKKYLKDIMQLEESKEVETDNSKS